MKANKMVALAVLAVMVLVSGAAYAETIQGEVASVDLAGKMLKVTKGGEAAGAKETLNISVSDATTYSGEVTALAEVVEGDKVKIEADKDAASGNWMAKSVDVSAAEETA